MASNKELEEWAKVYEIYNKKLKSILKRKRIREDNKIESLNSAGGKLGKV